MRKRTFIFISVYMMLSWNAALCIDAEEIIRDVRQKYDGIKSFSADFVQSFNWKLAGQSQEQKGKIILKDFDKFRIETEDQLIVSDGTTLWTYSRIHGQVIIDRIENAEEVILPRDLFLKFSQKYIPTLAGEEKIRNMDCQVVRMTAKSGDVYIKEMKIWVDKKSLLTTKIEQKDINDNLTTYVLENMVINQPLDPETFHYVVPKDVEVIDMR